MARLTDGTPLGGAQFLSVAMVALFSLLLFGGVGYCLDDENCFVCHRYSGLGAIGQDGKERVFYINEEFFRLSVHANVRCTSCHTDIKKIPHTKAKRVSCAQECHIKEPSSGRSFSHKPVYDEYKESVHGKDIRLGYELDKPNCVYCHQNPLCKVDPEKVSGDQLAVLLRCYGCHVDQDWTNRFFRHFVCRLQRRLTSAEVVNLCSSCHEDAEKMARYGLEPTWTLKDSFHYEAIKYGDPHAPNCITCHAPAIEGQKYDVHNLVHVSSPMSPLNSVEKKIQVCGQPGCHPGATPQFVKGKVHSAGLKFTILEEALLKKGVSLTPQQKKLILERAKKEEHMARVIYYVQLGYTIFIGVICGLMFIHQVLDFMASLRERRKARR